MTPDPKKVRVWEARAPAYDELCRRYDIFSRLSNRLIDLLPQDLEGSVLDIGAGSGVTSNLVLDRYPRCDAILVEPSEAMMNIARANLAGRPARFFVMGLDEAPAHGLHACAAVASASMQFLDLAPAFETLAQVIAPRGHVAFNLWYHHWEETAGEEGMSAWQDVARAACRNAHLELHEPAPVPQNAKTRKELNDASRRHGFELLSEHRDEYPTPVAFGVDFQAMDQDWPVKGLDRKIREALLKQMRELAHGQFENLISTRFLFQFSRIQDERS